MSLILATLIFGYLFSISKLNIHVNHVLCTYIVRTYTWYKCKCTVGSFEYRVKHSACKYLTVEKEELEVHMQPM